jgi:Arc/MetJ-type ribon-helix-helix transcriptional regulator
MTITFTAEQERNISYLIKTGQFTSPEDFLEFAFKQAQEKMLRDKVQKGTDELEVGKVSTLTTEDIKRLGREKACQKRSE